MLISIPPRYVVAQVIGYTKGKSATWIARTCGRRKNFIAQNFWASGCYVTTTELDEETVRDYIKEQTEVLQGFQSDKDFRIAKNSSWECPS
jgi:putative transposase